MTRVHDMGDGRVVSQDPPGLGLIRPREPEDEVVPAPEPEKAQVFIRALLEPAIETQVVSVDGLRLVLGDWAYIVAGGRVFDADLVGEALDLLGAAATDAVRVEVRRWPAGMGVGVMLSLIHKDRTAVVACLRFPNLMEAANPGGKETA